MGRLTYFRDYNLYNYKNLWSILKKSTNVSEKQCYKKYDLCTATVTEAKQSYEMKPRIWPLI